MSNEAGASAPQAAVEAAPEIQSQEEVSSEDLEILESEGSEQPVVAEAASKEQKQEAVKQEVDKQMQKWILKGLNGENIEISDINDLVKRAQKGLGAELKFQEAADIKKEAGQLLKMLNDDPMGLLEELGLDTVSLAQQKLSKKLEEDSKSPEQKQREQELQELQELREEKKRLQEASKKSEYERLVADEERKLEEGMLTALQQANLPVKPVYIKRMAEIMQAGMDHGVELSPAEALKFARKEVVGDLRELLDASPDEMLEDLIGNTNAQRIRKRYLAKAREAKANPLSQVKATGYTSEEAQEANSNRKKISTKDWLKGRG